MAEQPLKNNLIMILDILKKHSDAEHKLSQKDIQTYLKRDYEMTCDRKTVKRNLMNLIEFGFDIEYSEIERNGKEANVIITDIYYNHILEDSEVKLISDSLLFSKYISARETKQLIGKIESLASPFTKNPLKNSVNYETLGHTENPQIFLSIEILNEAIQKHKQVTFCYCEYQSDKKLHPKHDYQSVVNPYYTVTSNGRYYLIGNVDKYNNLAHFRVDKIKNIDICDNPAKSIRCLDDCKNGFELSSYMKEHIYMFGGNTVRVRLKTDSFLIGQIIDWFGRDFDVISDNGKTCVISLTVNENALFYWAMQYGEYVEVITPKKVRERIARAIHGMSRKYKPE